MAGAELLLYPVRLGIVKAFLGDRALTTSELAAELPDVPVGSLYGQVARLARAGVLQVVAERRVRGDGDGERWERSEWQLMSRGGTR